jgi:pimeloyl-ACP methyl ester carboxylesterase
MRDDKDQSTFYADRRQMLALAGVTLTLASSSGAQGASLTSDRKPRAPSTSTVRFVEINGARLAYQQHTGGGDRQLLIFSHGYGLRGTGAIYAPLIEQLTPHFDVYALDVRGHGASASSFANWSQTTIADDLAAFVSKLGLRGAVYAGHSLGGFTGLFAQIRHPGTFSALCLLATAAAGGNDAPASVEDAFVRDGRDDAKIRLAFRPLYMRPQPNDIRLAAEAVTLLDPAVHEAFYPNYGRNTITERLRDIDIPVLLINGAKDNVVSPVEQHKTAAGLRRSKEVILSGEGHMLPIEVPSTVARDMINFVLHDVPEMVS